MSDLDEILEWMVGALQRRGDLTRDPEAIAMAERHFRGSRRLSPVEQLEVYREQFWLRHTSSLVDDFPGLSGLLGQNRWEALVEAYLAAHPPRTPLLRDLGHGLPEFVAERHELPERELASDLARLEWTYVELFDAPEVAPITAEELSGVGNDAWPRARLLFKPALRLLRLAYPVDSLRRRILQQQFHGELPARAPRCVVVHRHDLRLAEETLPSHAALLLEALLGRAPLLQACETCAEQDPNAAPMLEEHLTTWFSRWSELGWITQVLL